MNGFLDAAGGLKRYLDILQLCNPFRTALGGACGGAVKGLSLLFAPALKRASGVVDFANVHVGYFVVLGVVALNLPMLSRRHRLPDDVEAALRVIRMGVREGNLTKVQARGLYLTLINKVIQDVCLENDRNGADRAGLEE